MPCYKGALIPCRNWAAGDVADVPPARCSHGPRNSLQDQSGSRGCPALSSRRGCGALSSSSSSQLALLGLWELEFSARMKHEYCYVHFRSGVKTESRSEMDEAHRFRGKVISKLQLHCSDNSINNIYFSGLMSHFGILEWNCHVCPLSLGILEVFFYFFPFVSSWKQL